MPETTMLLLPGFQFIPTDQELLDSYLRKKILHLSLPSNAIIDANVYNDDPENLAVRYQMTNEYCEWFFFTWTTRKRVGEGSRAPRIASSGRWKATQGIRRVFNSNGNILGWKQNFSYMKRSPSGKEEKSIWLMEEYSINQLQKSDGNSSEKLGRWIICKIYLTPKARRAYMQL